MKYTFDLVCAHALICASSEASWSGTKFFFKKGKNSGKVMHVLGLLGGKQ